MASGSGGAGGASPADWYKHSISLLYVYLQTELCRCFGEAIDQLLYVLGSVSHHSAIISE